MNKKTTYEVLIAEKVTQLPVPDMADAIWSRIELELDAVPGTDGGDQQMPSESLPGNVITTATKLWLIIIAVAVMTALIILFTKNKNNKPVDVKNIPATIQETGKKQELDSTSTLLNTNPGNGAVVPFQPVPQKTGDVPAPLISPVFNDSVFNEPLKNARNDSAISINTPPVIIKPDSAATMPPPPYKKPRGVKGIGDNDYKITSKKDSLKN